MPDILIRAGLYIGIIALGYFLRRGGFFKKEDFRVLSKIVINLTLPATLIAHGAGREVQPSMLTIAALGLGANVGFMLLAALVNRKAGKDQLAFALLNTPGYSIGTFTLPFAQSFMGPVGVLTTSLFDVGNAFVCLGGAYGVASSVKEGRGFDLGRVLKALGRSVPFLTHITVVTVNLLKLPIPSPVMSAAEIVGNANPFMAMLMIGVGFELQADREKLIPMVRILGVRYGLMVALAALCYWVLPFDLEVRQTLVLLVCSPIGSAVPGFTAQLKGDVGLSSAINSISILIGICTFVVLLMVML